MSEKVGWTLVFESDKFFITEALALCEQML